MTGRCVIATTIAGEDWAPTGEGVRSKLAIPALLSLHCSISTGVTRFTCLGRRVHTC